MTLRADPTPAQGTIDLVSPESVAVAEPSSSASTSLPSSPTSCGLSWTPPTPPSSSPVHTADADAPSAARHPRPTHTAPDAHPSPSPSPSERSSDGDADTDTDSSDSLRDTHLPAPPTATGSLLDAQDAQAPLHSSGNGYSSLPLSAPSSSTSSQCEASSMPTSDSSSAMLEVTSAMESPTTTTTTMSPPGLEPPQPEASTSQLPTPPSPSPSPTQTQPQAPTQPHQPRPTRRLSTPIISSPLPIPLSELVTIARFKPSPRDVISGIAPHVFDERRRRRSPARSPSASASSRARAERRRSGRWNGASGGVSGGGGFGERGRASPLRRSVVISWDERTIYLEEATYAGTITSRVSIDIATGAERTVLGDCPAIPDLLADKAKSSAGLGAESKGANAKSKSAKVKGGKVKGNTTIEVPRWTRRLRLDGGMFKTLFPRMRKREGVVAAAA
ncbi:hypothetical protein D9611_009864 [Ephemerocybe angulata]|uniref:Uncharacterized protein n=1 Tax=Ephemerocybe angulata TaxID=980116 RepID=A0A8H5FJU0_9AGAR|nr:hypothetical protein D9611_009864 [Tulosesus angulatus]